MLKVLFIENNLPERILIQSRIPDYCMVMMLPEVKDLPAMLTVTEADAVLIGPSVTEESVSPILKASENIRPELRFLLFKRINPEACDQVRISFPNCEVVVIPEDLQKLRVFLDSIAEERLKTVVKNPSYDLNRELSKLVGSSAGMNAVKDSIIKYSGAPGPVLITGESGTGKEIAARLLHDFSGRRERVFHAVNAGAIPRSLSATELFGSASGAFTGAVNRGGCFEHSDGGTLFLDEIGELDSDIQAELLRVLETGRVRRVGANEARKVDVRLISATNRELAEAVSEGSFRKDLLYRIDMFRVHIPPLRERKEDIPDLLMHFSEQLRVERPNRIYEFTDSFLDRLFEYHWPGNVRELRNVFRRAVYSTDDGMLTSDSVSFFRVF